MPRQQPVSGEYWWRQPEPVPVAMMAQLDLPRRISIAASYDAPPRRHSLSLVLSQSGTGLDHLILQPLQRHGETGATDIAHDLFVLLMNTLVVVLQRHCVPRLSLGGTVPTSLDGEHGAIDLPWQEFGFQLLGATTPNKRRVLARVRNLHPAESISRGNWPPPQLPWDEVEWR